MMKRNSGMVISDALGAVSALCVAALMITIIIDTTGRSLFAVPLAGANDFNRYWWMVLIVFFALGAAERRNEHIEALVLEAQMPPRLRVIWRYMRAAIVAVTLGLLLNAGIPAAIENQMQGEYAAGSEITIWPTRFILVIGVAVFLIATVLKAVEDHREILRTPSKGS
ncbi:TRAP transporter small permease [Brevibacterium luteolum]|nr:TRAP transporter small permease [Brevibacterium luteolum]